MKLSAPSKIFFFISVILAVIAIICFLVPVAILTTISFWILLVGFVVLALGCLLKGV